MAMRIIGIDHGSKESFVKEMGAEVFLDITKFDDKTLAEEVKKATGGKSPSHLLRLTDHQWLSEFMCHPYLRMCCDSRNN